jgi:hypothetical protein
VFPVHECLDGVDADDALKNLCLTKQRQYFEKQVFDFIVYDSPQSSRAVHSSPGNCWQLCRRPVKKPGGIFIDLPIVISSMK